MPTLQQKSLRACCFRCVLWLTLAVAFAAGNVVAAQDYRFDGPVSREVLENYLARSITFLDLLTEKGDFDDNLRLLENVGAKFVGRSAYRWGGEADLPRVLALAEKNAKRVHDADPDIVLQACLFEIVSSKVDRLAVPSWAFETFGMPVEQRNFSYQATLYPDGILQNHWGTGASVPDISRKETQLWFYFLARSYIDAGIEALHLGQVELMNRRDQDFTHWAQVLDLIHEYGRKHARRHWVLCDAHVPCGGLLLGDRLLLDFHSFPLRIKEVPERPQQGILEVGFTDAIYGRSRGGITPSGWRCDHLPYLVEVDNWGGSDRPGQPGVGGCWVWGYDEMSWFAHQPEDYRNEWLRYAWKWVRDHDPAGYLQMPGSRIVHSPIDGKHWYFANMPSDATPDGFGQEDTIRQIWEEDSRKSGPAADQRDSG